MDNDDEQLVPELTVSDVNTALTIYAACMARSRELALQVADGNYRGNVDGWRFTIAASVELHRVGELAWAEYQRLHAENAHPVTFTESLPVDSGETTQHADTRQ